LRRSLQVTGRRCFTGATAVPTREALEQLVDSNWTVCAQSPGPGPAEEGSDVEQS